MNNTEYLAEINSIAQSMAEEALSDNDNDIDVARDDIQDSRLHETIDGHQWVIYNAYNLDVIQHSDNADYYESNFGGEDMAYVLKESGLDGLHNVIAFWCIYADVQDLIEEALEEAETESETA